jgi:DNA-binding NarL/FixJ family response regulator
VDDELWATLDMEWVVQKLGHQVVGTASTAEKAIELAGRDQPDLVLMDIRLAENGDGVAAAIEIRRRFDIPSLFISAHDDQISRDRAAAARPWGFIEKPFSPESLSKAIETALNPKVF